MSNNTRTEETAADRRKVLSNESKGEEVLGIPKPALITGFSIAVGFWAIANYYVPPRLGPVFRILAVIAFIASVGFAYSTRRGLSVSEKFARVLRHNARQQTMLNIRNGSVKEQPYNNSVAAFFGSLRTLPPIRHVPLLGRAPDDDSQLTVLGRLARLPIARNLAVIGQRDDQRPQDYAHAVRPFHQSPAVETDDGSVIGAIKIEPAAMAVADGNVWEQRVERLADAIDSSAVHKTQFTSKMRAVDYTGRMDTYTNREEEFLEKLSQKHGSLEQAYAKIGEDMETSDIDHEDLGWMVAADLCDERQELIDLYDVTTLRRDYYATIKVEPKDVVTPAHVDADSGGLHTIPYFGAFWKRHKLRKLRKEGDHTAAMIERLGDALTEFENELRKIDGITPRQISSTEFSAAIADHYRAANVYATADFDDLLRVSPTPSSPSGEALYGADYSTLQTLPSESLGGPSPEALSAGQSTTAADGGADAEDGADSFADRVAEANDYPIADIVRSSGELAEHYQSTISPNRIDEPSENWIAIDNAAYSKTFSIRNWPAVPKMGILEPIIRGDMPGVAVNVATHISPEDQQQAQTDLDAAESETEKTLEKSTNQDTIRGKIDPFTERYRSEHEQATEMKEANRQSDYDLFKTNTHLELRSDDPDALQETINRIRNDMDDEGARIEEEDFAHLEGYQSTAPVCNDKLEEPIRMLADGIAREFMWTSKNLHEKSGVELGHNIHTNEPLHLDFWKRQSGFDFGVFGPKGHGKTTTVTRILNLIKLVYGDDVFVAMIDPLQEFGNLATAHNGEHLVAGGSGLNPFHLEPTPEDKLDALDVSPFSVWIKAAMDFVEMYYEDEGLDFTGKQGVWRIAIREAAERYGITSDPKTHDPEWRESHGYSGDCPTPLDAIKVIDEMSENGEDFVYSLSGEHDGNEDEVPNPGKVEEREQTAIEIINNDVQPFIGDGEYSHFTEQTDLDLDDVSLLYADMQQQENDGSLGLTMHVLYDLIYEKVKTIDRPGLIFIDEFHYLLRDDLAQQSLNLKIRHGRHWDLSHGTSTQSFKDYFGTDSDGNVHLTDNAEVLFENMPTRIYHQAQITDEWLKPLGLSRDEADFIEDCEPGDPSLGFATTLLDVRDQGSYPLKIKMDRSEENPREAIFADYDPSDHGTDMLRYLLKNDDVANWRFADHHNVADAVDAEGVGR